MTPYSFCIPYRAIYYHAHIHYLAPGAAVRCYRLTFRGMFDVNSGAVTVKQRFNAETVSTHARRDVGLRGWPIYAPLNRVIPQHGVRSAAYYALRLFI